MLIQSPHSQPYSEWLIISLFTFPIMVYILLPEPVLSEQIAFWAPTVSLSSVQLLSCVWLFATPSTAESQASLSITNSWSLLNSHPSSWGCHPTISYSVIPFSSRLQSFPVSGSFQMSQFFVQVVKVLEFQLQHQSFQWTFRTDVL